MTDAFDSYRANPTSVPPLTRAVADGMPTTSAGVTVGPCITDASLRAILDALRAIEDRVTTLEA